MMMKDTIPWANQKYASLMDPSAGRQSEAHTSRDAKDAFKEHSSPSSEVA